MPFWISWVSFSRRELQDEIKLKGRRKGIATISLLKKYLRRFSIRELVFGILYTYLIKQNTTRRFRRPPSQCKNIVFQPGILAGVDK